MFAVPRQKKPLLPAHSRKRKTTSNIEEISFDSSARQEYLTGFHKRKQARIKLAQEENAKKARQEKLATRKQVGRILIAKQHKAGTNGEVRCVMTGDEKLRNTCRT